MSCMHTMHVQIGEVMRLQPQGTWQGLRGGVKPIVILTSFIALFIVISLYNWRYRAREYDPALIVKELRQLQEIFMRIDKDCKILGFDHIKNPINFLNVGTFTGSEVGSMNLGYPKNWKGPYATDNPHVQNIEYQIIKTNKGFFITPGDGVVLPNGKIVGKDVILNENSDIATMMHDDRALMSKGHELAAALPLKTATWQKVMLQNIGGLDEGL